MSRPIVIIGAGHAGVHTAARLAELKWPGEIVLIDEEDAVPYERPPLSKDLLKPSAPDQAPLLRKESFYADKNIHRIAGQAVTALDRGGRTVELADGTTVPYHRLVLATGSRARALAVPGAELPGVQVLKTRGDAFAVKSALRPGARVVIVGAGYIGMEVAAAAAAAGCDTTVLEFQDRVMSRVTSEPVTRHFEALHREQGVRFVFGASVTGIEGSDRAERVVTADGSTFDADVVVVGIGVVPNQAIAEVSGLECSDGILVDEHARTSDPYIYAAGDVTRFTCPREGISLRLECIQNALAQADSAVHHILGKEPKKQEIPWFWTVQHGVRLQTAGVRNPEDEIVVRGDSATGKFSVLYLRDGRLAAIDTVQALSDFMAGKKLIAARAQIDPILAADPDTGLAQAQAALVAA